MRGFWRQTLRFGFRLLYNELAFTYDLVSFIVSLGVWRDWQLAALRYVSPVKSGPILELAHGTGSLQIELAHRDVQSIGIDASKAMGLIARRKLCAAKLPLKIARSRVQALPFGAGAFKTIVSTFPTEFIVEERVLCEMHRVLAADGEAIIVINGVLEGRGALRRFLEWLFRITGQRADREMSDPYQDIQSQFYRSGFAARVERVACRRNSTAIVLRLTKH